MAKARIEPAGWHRGMNYLEERKILDGMLDKIEAIEKKIFFKDKIVWLPEYDDMMLTYLPPEEIKKYEAEGKNRKEILNIAEDKIAEASWNANKDVNMGSFWASRDKNRQNEVFMGNLYAGVIPEVIGSAKKDKEVYKKTYFAEHRVREVMRFLHETGFERWTALQFDAQRQIEEERSARKCAPIRDLMNDSTFGEKALDDLKADDCTIKFEFLGKIACSVDPERKRVVLNSASTHEAASLSLVHAARIFQQDRISGPYFSDLSNEEYQAVRKADALAAQAAFAEETSLKHPKILETFKKNGNGPLYNAFKSTLTETDDLNAARSAAVDCYLKAAFPKSNIASETIDKICTFRYAKPEERKKKTEKSTLFNEPAFNAVFAAKAQQGGR